jgi:hypothetical protein
MASESRDTGVCVSTGGRGVVVVVVVVVVVDLVVVEGVVLEVVVDLVVEEERVSIKSFLGLGILSMINPVFMGSLNCFMRTDRESSFSSPG